MDATLKNMMNRMSGSKYTLGIYQTKLRFLNQNVPKMLSLNNEIQASSEKRNSEGNGKHYIKKW